jgi:hypothetical protein
MDPLSLAVGAVVLAVGYVFGRFSPTRRRVQQPKASDAVCDCKHSLAYHDMDGCHVSAERDKYSSLGDWRGKEYVPCECKQYTGPKVLDPGFIAQEIISG